MSDTINPNCRAAALLEIEHLRETSTIGCHVQALLAGETAKLRGDCEAWNRLAQDRLAERDATRREADAEIARLTKERDDAIALNQLYHRTRHDHRDFAKNAQEQRDDWQKEATRLRASIETCLPMPDLVFRFTHDTGSALLYYGDEFVAKFGSQHRKALEKLWAHAKDLSDKLSKAVDHENTY